MKTNLQNKKRLSSWIALLSILVFTLGCDNSSDPELNYQALDNSKKSESDSEQPQKPTIDIHTAVMTNDIEALQQHILAGSDIDQKDPFGGSSPLISAALFGHKDMVELLINSGADIDFKNNDGSTALITAAFFCRTEVVQLLLDNDADKSIKNNDGSTAYDTVSAPFQVVKPIYDMIGQALAPMGLVLDYKHLESTRPIIAALLK